MKFGLTLINGLDTDQVTLALTGSSHDSLRLRSYSVAESSHFFHAAELLLDLLQRRLPGVISRQTETAHVSAVSGVRASGVNDTLVGAVALQVRSTAAPAGERLPTAGPRLACSGSLPLRCWHGCLPA